MKKILLIIMAVIATVSANAQTYYEYNSDVYYVEDDMYDSYEVRIKRFHRPRVTVTTYYDNVYIAPSAAAVVTVAAASILWRPFYVRPHYTVVWHDPRPAHYFWHTPVHVYHTSPYWIERHPAHVGYYHGYNYHYDYHYRPHHHEPYHAPHHEPARPHNDHGYHHDNHNNNHNNNGYHNDSHHRNNGNYNNNNRNNNYNNNNNGNNSSRSGSYNNNQNSRQGNSNNNSTSKDSRPNQNNNSGNHRQGSYNSSRSGSSSSHR
ncbi:MAG: hypothetical protein IKP73_07895 [Bacteroidales bacterium]|nr:hypothetical protein [Bacteroidales bacterium]